MSASETDRCLFEAEKQLTLFEKTLLNLHNAIANEHSLKKKQAEEKKDEYYRQFQEAFGRIR